MLGNFLMPCTAPQYSSSSRSVISFIFRVCKIFMLPLLVFYLIPSLSFSTGPIVIGLIVAMIVVLLLGSTALVSRFRKFRQSLESVHLPQKETVLEIGDLELKGTWLDGTSTFLSILSTIRFPVSCFIVVQFLQLQVFGPNKEYNLTYTV